MILRLLNVQGIAGIAVGLGLLALFFVQKIEIAHWKKQSAGLEQLYRQEQSALATTVANTRAAAAQARAEDQANASRVAAEQAAINERTTDDLEARLAVARAAAARRLHIDAEAAASAGGGSPMPSLPTAARSSAEGALQDRLPATDALTATEQAIQLDELIKWVRAQAAVDNNPKAVASSSGG